MNSITQAAETLSAMERTYPFPDFGTRGRRHVPESSERDAPNATRSRLQSLIDFDKVLRANERSRRETGTPSRA